MGEMRSYVKHVWELREAERRAGRVYEHIAPGDVCYHIFNVTGSRALIEDLAGNQPAYDSCKRMLCRGDAMPIKMWQYPEVRNEDGELCGWDLKLDERASTHVLKKAQELYGPR